MKWLLLAFAGLTACVHAGAARSATSPSTSRAIHPTSRFNVARFGGCKIFTAGDFYNANVASAALDPNGAGYIKSLVSGGDDASGFYASTGVEFVNLANNATSREAVHQKVSYHSFSLPYPWRASFRIEPLDDAHAIVLETGSCHLYELYSATYSSGALAAYSGADWNLARPFAPLPSGHPSAMASGLSLFAGMVKWEEYESGSIDHALNWAPRAKSTAQYEFVRPASDTDGLAYGGAVTPAIPYGAHLRLRASFRPTGFGPEALAVVKAMQTYGIYVADTGSEPNALYFANKLDGTNPWSSSDLSSLQKVRITDFVLLRLPPVQTVPGH